MEKVLLRSMARSRDSARAFGLNSLNRLGTWLALAWVSAIQSNGTTYWRPSLLLANTLCDLHAVLASHQHTPSRPQ